MAGINVPGTLLPPSCSDSSTSDDLVQSQGQGFSREGRGNKPNSDCVSRCIATPVKPAGIVQQIENAFVSLFYDAFSLFSSRPILQASSFSQNSQNPTSFSTANKGPQDSGSI